jgi:hypothetical protein
MATKIVLTLSHTGEPQDVASYLRWIADRIERGDAWEEPPPGNPTVHVRSVGPGSSGEEPLLGGRFYAVMRADGDGDPVAMFADREDADAFRFDDNADMCTLRADVVGSVWNSIDPDPVCAEDKS